MSSGAYVLLAVLVLSLAFGIYRKVATANSARKSFHHNRGFLNTYTWTTITHPR